MATDTIVAFEKWLYQRRLNGKILKYSGTPFNWELIDNNKATEEIAIANNVYQRHHTGPVYQRVSKDWTVIDDEQATIAIAAAAGHLYQLRRVTGDTKQIWKYDFDAEKWSQISSDENVAQIAADGAAVYKRLANKSLYKYNSGTVWDSIDGPNHAEELRVGGGNVYQRLANGEVWRYKQKKEWTLIGAKGDIVRIAAGPAGVCRLHRNGLVDKWSENQTWTKIDDDSRNVDVVVGNDVWFRRSDYTIYKQDGKHQVA